MAVAVAAAAAQFASPNFDTCLALLGTSSRESEPVHEIMLFPQDDSTRLRLVGDRPIRFASSFTLEMTTPSIRSMATDSLRIVLGKRLLIAPPSSFVSL